MTIYRNAATLAPVAIRKQEYEVGPRCCISFAASIITSLALIVLSSLAIAGTFPGPSSTLGWILVGLGGASCIALIMGLKKPKKMVITVLITLVATAALIGVGVAGGLGALNMYQLGVAVICLTILGLGMASGCAKQYDLKRNRQNTSVQQLQYTLQQLRNKTE